MGPTLPATFPDSNPGLWQVFLSRLPGNSFCILMIKMWQQMTTNMAYMRGWASRVGLVPRPGPGQAKPTSCSFVESTRTSLAQWASVGMVGLGAGGASVSLQGRHPAWHLPPPTPSPTPAAGAFHLVIHSLCYLSLGDDFTLITLIKQH